MSMRYTFHAGISRTTNTFECIFECVSGYVYMFWNPKTSQGLLKDLPTNSLLGIIHYKCLNEILL